MKINIAADTGICEVEGIELFEFESTFGVKCVLHECKDLRRYTITEYYSGIALANDENIYSLLAIIESRLQKNTKDSIIQRSKEMLEKYKYTYPLNK